MEEQQPQNIAPYTHVRYVTMGQLIVYFVSEDQLRMIERGAPSSAYFNLATFFLSSGASFLVSLLLSKPGSIYTFTVMVALVIGTLITGFVLLVLWFRSRKDVSDVIKEIRDRGVAASKEIPVGSVDSP